MGVPMCDCSVYAKPAFSARIVEAHEPVRVQTFCPELAVERFDEGIVGAAMSRGSANSTSGTASSI
jgi:hypothetical protein